jgi:hypothetical protein
LTIDLDDNINTYRKVIMINYPWKWFNVA